MTDKTYRVTYTETRSVVVDAKDEEYALSKAIDDRDIHTINPITIKVTIELEK